MDIFSNFYEENQTELEFQKITERLFSEAVKEKGLSPPVVFFHGCTPVEQEVVCKYFDQTSQALHIQQDNHENPAVPIPCYLPQQQFSALPCVQAIKRLTDKEKSVHPNTYELMQAFLSAVSLRRYNGSFYMWNGIYFREVCNDELRRIIFGILEPAIATGKGTQILRQVLELLQSYPAIYVDTTTENPTRLFMANGCLDLASGQLYSISSRDFFTSCIMVEYPLDFIPPCPTFDKFLLEITAGDSVLIEAFLEAIGYLLTTDMAAKAFILFCGIGDSGKSVLGNLVSSFFNPEAVSFLDIFRFRDRFSTSQLKGKRLNVSMDLPHGRISREAMGVIKLITGDDVITIEEKFKGVESYKSTCKLLFGSNYPLQLAEPDEAFGARLVALPFRIQIPKERQDKRLLDKLLQERSGILCKVLAAFTELKRRNYQFLGVSEMDMCTGYAPQGEELQHFLTSCCTFGGDFIETTAALHMAFNKFCIDNNFSGIPDRVQFSKQLKRVCGKQIVPQKIRNGAKTYNAYVGIKLNIKGEK